MSDRTVAELVGLVYAAASEPEAWAAFLRSLTTELKADWGALYVHHLAEGRCTVLGDCGFDPGFRQAYEERYGAMNAFLLHGAARLRSGLVFSNEELCPDAVLVGTEFHTEWLAPQGMGRGLTAIVARDGAVMSLLTIVRKRGQDGLDANAKALLSVLTPHVQRALQIQRTLGRAKSLVQGVSAALDGWRVGVVVVDRLRNVLAANEAARTLMDRRDGIAMVRGRLAATSADEAVPFQGLFADIPTAGTVAPAGFLSLARAEATRPLRLMVTTTPASDGVAHPVQRASHVLFVADPDREPAVDHAQLGHVFRLTPTEAKVAALMGRGYDSEAICEKLTIARNTLKTHVKRVFAKTGVHRQSQLVALVAALPQVQSRVRPAPPR